MPPPIPSSTPFGQQLLHDPGPARAERAAQRDLLGAPVGAHQHQVGEVGAGDEQHERDRAEQDEQRQPGVADQVVVQRHDQRAPVLVVGRVLLLPGARDRVEIGLRRAPRHARLQLGHGAIVVVVAHGAIVGLPRQRHPHLHLLEKRRRRARRRPRCAAVRSSRIGWPTIGGVGAEAASARSLSLSSTVGGRARRGPRRCVNPRPTIGARPKIGRKLRRGAHGPHRRRLARARSASAVRRGRWPSPRTTGSAPPSRGSWRARARRSACRRRSSAAACATAARCDRRRRTAAAAAPPRSRP